MTRTCTCTHQRLLHCIWPGSSRSLPFTGSHLHATYFVEKSSPHSKSSFEQAGQHSKVKMSCNEPTSQVQESILPIPFVQISIALAYSTPFVMSNVVTPSTRNILEGSIGVWFWANFEPLHLGKEGTKI